MSEQAIRICGHSFIGIDTYEVVSGLHGCVSDVQAMRIFLNTGSVMQYRPQLLKEETLKCLGRQTEKQDNY